MAVCAESTASPGATSSGAIRLHWPESPCPPGLAWTLRASHALPAHLPRSTPSSVPGRASLGPQEEGGQAPPSPCPAHQHCVQPQTLPLWALYPPWPEPASCLGCSQPLQLGNPLGRNAFRASLFLRQCGYNGWGSGEGAPTGPSLASVNLATISGHRASLPGGCQATLGQDICCPTTAQSLGDPGGGAVADSQDK